MKAIVINQTGGVENFIIQNLDKPGIKDNEVLIETKSLGINPVDFKVRGNDDLLTMIYGEQRPAIIGWDVAGIVSEVGSGVTELKVGDRVFGHGQFYRSWKCLRRIRCCTG